MRIDPPAWAGAWRFAELRPFFIFSGQTDQNRVDTADRLTDDPSCRVWVTETNFQRVKTMTLTKTTINMARRRGLAITVTEDDELNGGISSVEFAAIDDGEPADEYAALYTMTSGGLFFVGGCGDTEEWPYWIQSESHLRALLPAMAAAI